MREYPLRIILGFITTLFATLVGFSALADETKNISLGDRAIETALKLEHASQQNMPAHNLELSLNLRRLRDHQYSRIEIWNGFDSSSDNSFLDIILEYKTFAENSGDTQDIALAHFYVDLSKIYNPYSAETANRTEDAISFLENHLDSNFWTIKHSASIILSVLYSYQKDIPTALELAKDSFLPIPEEEVFEAQVSRFYSYGLTTYLHGVTKNSNMYLSSVEGLIVSSSKIGHPIESVNHLNNLIYTMRSVENKEVTRRLVDILLRVGQNHPSDTPGLVEMRAANALIRIGDFKRALDLSKNGQEKATIPRIFDILKVAEIQSLAATGDPAQAGKELAAFERKIADNEADLNYFNSDILKARGLISMANGEANATFHLMDRYAESSLQKILKSNNANTSNLLANLENDKARQAEREAAREEMFHLEEEALKQRIAAGHRGLIILLMLALAAISTAVFMAYRARVSRKFALAAEAALAGEKVKTQFLAVISHELRTPLNGIIGIADLLSRTAPTLDLRDKISIINNSGQDLLKLVEQILDMSRIDANEMEVYPDKTNIRDVIAGIDTLWRPTIEDKGVIFTAHIDPSVPDYLTLDPMRLRQCVNNLVSNAAKFTKEGRVHIHVVSTPQPDNNKATLTVIVADTGMGIREDVQEKLFRPFVQADSSITRQYGGSGLGLAITRSLARMMDGDLSVTSRHGAGSEFTLTLTAQLFQDTDLLDTMDDMFGAIEIADGQTDTPPLERALAPALLPVAGAPALSMPKQKVLAQDVAADIALEGELHRGVLVNDLLTQSYDIDKLQGLRVLVVEDMPSNQDVLKIFLEPEGCEVICASNGLEALQELESQDFDVVLMDIRMPEMDGIEATRLIRSEGKRNTNVPIIALTADATAETNAQCMAAGANIFLTKPVIATELFDFIRFVRRQALHRAETQQADKEELTQRIA